MTESEPSKGETPRYSAAQGCLSGTAGRERSRSHKVTQEDNHMDNSFMRVEDVANELGISKSYAYKIVQKLNRELNEKGYLTISGRVNRKYFTEKFCYGLKEGGVQNGRL
jgi:hypothetical protein